MKRSEDSRGQTAFLRVLSEPDVAQQLALLHGLLIDGFESEVNRVIPSEGLTPLQLCARRLDDNRLEIFTILLQCADISEMARDGESLFDCLVPVQWRKKDMLYALLETVEEPERMARIFGAVISTAAEEVKRELEYRLPTMYPKAWALATKQAVGKDRLAATKLE